MIIVLHGADEFRIAERIKAIRLSITPEDLRDLNTTLINAQENTIEELFLTASMTPFMTEKRLVVAKDFVRAISTNSPKGIRSGMSAGLDDSVLALSKLPDSTVLVLRENDLGVNNPLIRKFKDMATVEYFPSLKLTEVMSWIRNRTKFHGALIEESASSLLANYIGPELRVLDSELMKLCLYKNFSTIQREDVLNFVSYSRQRNIFSVVDACINRKIKEALEFTEDLVFAGESPFGISRLIERQVKLLIRAKNLKESGVGTAAVSKRLSLYGYPLQKTLEQEKSISFRALSFIHDHILASEVRVRNGHMDELTSLKTLIVDIGTVSK